jgi:hypothetical protein
MNSLQFFTSCKTALGPTFVALKLQLSNSVTILMWDMSPACVEALSSRLPFFWGIQGEKFFWSLTVQMGIFFAFLCVGFFSWQGCTSWWRFTHANGSAEAATWAAWGNLCIKFSSLLESVATFCLTVSCVQKNLVECLPKFQVNLWAFSVLSY